MRLRKIHFVIHNQGIYCYDKKEQLLTYLKNKYPTLEGYLICQEMYSHQSNDSHLQGNLFFTNAIHHTAIIKYLKAKYTPKGQESIGRVEIMPVLHEGRAYNYMINESKSGGDSDPICDLAALDARKAKEAFTQELRELMCKNYKICHYKRYLATVWPADGPDAPPYESPTVVPADFLPK